MLFNFFWFCLLFLFPFGRLTLCKCAPCNRFGSFTVSFIFKDFRCSFKCC